jgi:hypothetical protein
MSYDGALLLTGALPEMRNDSSRPREWRQETKDWTPKRLSATAPAAPASAGPTWGEPEPENPDRNGLGYATGETSTGGYDLDEEEPLRDRMNEQGAKRHRAPLVVNPGTYGVPVRATGYKKDHTWTLDDARAHRDDTGRARQPLQVNASTFAPIPPAAQAHYKADAVEGVTMAECRRRRDADGRASAPLSTFKQK